MREHSIRAAAWKQVPSAWIWRPAAWMRVMHRVFLPAYHSSLQMSLTMVWASWFESRACSSGQTLFRNLFAMQKCLPAIRRFLSTPSMSLPSLWQNAMLGFLELDCPKFTYVVWAELRAFEISLKGSWNTFWMGQVNCHCHKGLGWGTSHPNIAFFVNGRKVTFTLQSFPPLSWAHFESSPFFPYLGIVAVFMHRRTEILPIDKFFRALSVLSFRCLLSIKVYNLCLLVSPTEWLSTIMFIYVYDFFSWQLIISLKNHARTLWKGIVELRRSLGSTAPLQVAATRPKVSLSSGYTEVFGAIDLPSLSNWASLRGQEVWVTQMQAGTDSHLCYSACLQHISRTWNVGSAGWCVDCCS